MTKDDYRELKRQTKKERIFVSGITWSIQTSTNVTAAHRDMFAIIQSLGRILYHNYGGAYIPNNDIPDKPWELQNKLRASKLRSFAARCRKENRNEAGWRYEIESRLLERFNIEVACKRCRKRLWMSEVQVDPNWSNSKTTSLQERQGQREPCKCNPAGRIDCMDPGLSELFSSRIQETVYQLGQTESQPFNPKKQPDRIHGLQMTTNLEKILQEPYAHDDPPQNPPRLIEDVVKTSMTLENGGDPLLFPFLVLEAKGEKGPQGFEYMEVQTAFPIKNALKLQYDLLKTCGNTMDVPSGPLVWFLANHGEDWRVYGATVYEEEGKPNYWINLLWCGNITGYDAALQLILIVDLILDWARDIYRPNIIRQLKKLKAASVNDATTCGADPDVYSLREEVQPWMRGQVFEPEDIIDPNIPDEESVALDDEPLDNLCQFKTPRGLIRDARMIESSLRAIYITRDNAQTPLKGFENKKDAENFARSVLATLGRRCVVLDGEHVLNTIEDKWTCNVRPRRSLRSQTSKVYAQFRVSYFINRTWEQIRELSYIAVAENAREELIEAAKLTKGAVRRSRFAPPECPEQEILRSIDWFLQRSVWTDFTSALARRTYSLNMEEIPVISMESTEVHEPTSFRMIKKLDKDRQSPGVGMNGLVHYIYQKCRILNREPSEPFIRASARVDYEGRSLWDGWEEGDEPPSHEGYLDRVLVYGDIQKSAAQGSEQKLCLYVLDGKPEELNIFSITVKLLWFLRNDRIYGTVLKGKVYRNSRNWADNRKAYSFDVKDVEDSLNVSREVLRGNIFDWIKGLNVEESSLDSPMVVVKEVEAGLRLWARSRKVAAR